MKGTKEYLSIIDEPQSHLILMVIKKRCMFIFELIIITAHYYIHKVNWDDKKIKILNFDVKISLETISKSKNLKQGKLYSCLIGRLQLFSVKCLSLLFCIFLTPDMFSYNVLLLCTFCSY